MISTMTDEYVMSRFEYTEGDEIRKCYFPGWLLDDNLLFTVSDYDILVYRYKREGAEIVVDEYSEIVASVRLSLKENPERVFDLREFRNMSFMDFIYRVIEVGRDING
ncbi:hypothetical protein LCL96_12535 [Rossellomorea aquimaris]|uniref:hypothetical protein n=1 Tax=Rossellomorea aquimaris TaxID=189382 RepID=UPI001CD5F5E8|nr:hypothetical protein [Rossellomorea aquimaris]MCA1059775.1 hypothetical protein [Rossellomorea aquimaris]